MCLKTIIVAIIVLIITRLLISASMKEAFGTSPGTLVQLESTHVPSSPYEIAQVQTEERARVRRDLMDMTGSM